MLWRKPDKTGHFDPYKILISEVMLQQTQVDRVTPKYTQFLHKFPTVQDLAAAKLSDVLKVWNGLGYNRRAKYIHEAAKMIVKDFDGKFPQTIAELKGIPGIGPNTAGAVVTYAYNQPVVFVETNIRTVIIHHFFTDHTDVPDSEIKAVLTHLLIEPWDRDKRGMHGAQLEPRQFYYAMMDYGAYLKKTVGNLSRASKHYTRQSAFNGSLRQVRGQVIRLLTDGPMSEKQLHDQISDERLDDVLDALHKEALVSRHGQRVSLS
jgi:A/G-specific adenine glycosylase